ncbi:MAG: GDP-mannose 4,6-dehydratase [Candidatus Helarchaeota archaeon]
MGCILITGGLGFIGTNLTNHLLSHTNDEIVVYDNFSRRNVQKNRAWLEKIHRNSSRLKIVKGDVCDYKTLQKIVKDVERIYHLAGQVAVTSSMIDPIMDFNTNAQGTLNVLEIARHLETDPSLILTSTNKVYGALEKVSLIETENRYDFSNYKQGISEKAMIDPYNPYGCSKYCADAYCRDYYRTYGVRTIVFRMSCIYGLHQFGTEDQGWIAHFIISSVLNRKITIYGDGKQLRDILYIQDLIDAFELALKHITTTKGEVYNMGGGPKNTISLLELIELLEALLNRKISYDCREWRPGDQKVYYSDITKAKKDFNWTPKISKEDGVKKLFEWISNNLVLFK